MTVAPRTFRLVMAVAVIGLIALSFGLSRATAPDTEAGPASLDKVVIFSIPGLAIDDLDKGLLPNLDRLADNGSIAVANVRIRSAEPNLAGAYASLGAGNRTGDVESDVLAFAPTDQVGGVTVAQQMEAATGTPVTGQVLLPAAPDTATQIMPEGGSAPGALADALHAGGLRTGVVTNASSTAGQPGSGTSAPAALAVATPAGSVDAGVVGPELLSSTVGPDGSERVSSDASKVAAAVQDTLDDADVVVVDPGDTTRAAVTQAAADALPVDPSAPEPEPEPDDRLRTDALVHTDDVLGKVRAGLDRQTLLLVVGVTPPGSTWALTPVIASGPGVPAGYLASASTHRPALVTLTDLAPSILDTLDVDVPTAMIGTPLRYRPADASWTQARRLDDLLDSQASVSLAMTVTFVVVQSVVYGFLFLLLLAPRLPSRLRWLLEFGALACGAWPVSTFLLRLGTSLYSLGPGTFALSWLIAVALALAAQRLRRHPLDPLLAVAGLTVAVLVADLSTGSHLQLGSFFGYPPQTAPRFIGLGNSAFAILAGATLATIAAIALRTADLDGDRDLAWWGGVTVGVLAVFAVGAPWTGADVGGTLALVPVLVITLWALKGRPLSWKVVLAAAGLAVVVLAMAVGIEALRDPSQRTHVGRFFLNSGDTSTVLETIRRKWDLNMAAISQSPATLVVPFIVAFAFGVVGRIAPIRRVVGVGSVTRITVLGTVAVGIAGWLLNDSGLIVLALACVELGPLLALLVLRAPAVPAIPAVEPVPPVAPPWAALPANPVVVALVPAKDRADSIGETVEALLLLDSVDRVLVIDDGSGDDTADRARLAGADVLRLPVNRGKGGAVLAGAAQSTDADIYLLIDADLARTAAAADALLEPVRSGIAEMTIGVLPPAAGRAGFGTIKRLAGRGVARASGFEPAAPLSGQRAIRAELLRELPSAERFGLEVAMTIDVVRAGGRVAEVDVPMDHRHTGRSLSGFAHRGRQGLDIARSLWPRLVARPVRLGLLAGAVGLVAVGGYVSATAAVPVSTPPTAPASKVVVIGIAQVGLDDVTPERMANLARLADDGAFGMATPRSRGGPGPEAGYATLGAGDRARVPRPEIAGTAGVAQVARQGDEIVVPHFDEVLAAAPGTASGEPGALGQALHEAGLRTAVVANSASPIDVPPFGAPAARAPAALAVADRSGVVDGGSIGPELLVPDLNPSGVRSDAEAFGRAVREALDQADVVVVDSGDTDRAQRYRSTVDAVDGETLRLRALADTDAVIGAVAAALPADSRLIVVGLAPSPGRRLVPLVVTGPGQGGHRLTSPSTRRPDLVALTDLAPTVLESLGTAVPDRMIGQAVQYSTGRPDRADLLRQDRRIRIRDNGYGTVLNTFIWTVGALYLVAALVLLTGRFGPMARNLLRWAALTTTAWPFATFVVRGLGPLYDLGALTHLLVWAIAGLLATGAARWRTHPLDPLLVIGGFTLALITIDLATGAHLQTSSYLGYTPSVAARFVGIGNAPFGVYAAAAVLVGAAWVARSSRPADAWFGAAAVAVTVVVFDGAPWLGSDVGGILTLVPSFGLLLLLLSGRRPTWRSVLALGSGTVALLGAAVGIEALRPPDQRTHIGQFFLSGDQSSFWTTITRKWDVNLLLLRTSNWTWLIVIVLAFLLIGRGWPKVSRPGSSARAALLALGSVATIGWVTNDSGPLVAGLALVFLGATVILLATSPTGTDPVVEPATARRDEVLVP